jgi:two-component system invasion response regulator UvrY
LIAAIKQIALGELYIEQGLINHDNAELFESTATKYVDYKGIIDSFSAREFDVFLLLAKGLTAHKIADELCMGYKTAANYGTQIRSKLDVSSIAELAHIAIMSGMMKD